MRMRKGPKTFDQHLRDASRNRRTEKLHGPRIYRTVCEANVCKELGLDSMQVSSRAIAEAIASKRKLASMRNRFDNMPKSASAIPRPIKNLLD